MRDAHNGTEYAQQVSPRYLALIDQLGTAVASNAISDDYVCDSARSLAAADSHTKYEAGQYTCRIQESVTPLDNPI